MSGHAWARTGFGVGVVVSVAANVAHTYVIARHPALGARIAAGFFPIALLISVEILSRVAWPHGWGWQAARFGGVGAVAAVAAVISYRHMAGLLTSYGEDSVSATIGPLAVDGLMVIASVGLLAVGHQAAQWPDMSAVTSGTSEADETAGEPWPPETPQEPPSAAEKRAVARDALLRDPHLSGAALGRLVGVSARHGGRLKREVEAELAAAAARVDDTFTMR